MRSRMVFNYGTELSDALAHGWHNGIFFFRSERKRLRKSGFEPK